MWQGDPLRPARFLPVTTREDPLGRNLAACRRHAAGGATGTGVQVRTTSSFVDPPQAAAAPSDGGKADGAGYVRAFKVGPRVRMPSRHQRSALARSVVLWILLILMSAAVWDQLRSCLGDGAIAVVIILLAGVTVLSFFGEHGR